jgi:hypothetical protein
MYGLKQKPKSRLKMMEKDFKVEKMPDESIPSIQVIVLTDDRGVSYEYYGAPFMDHVPKIKSLFVGPVVCKEDVIEYLEDGFDLLEGVGSRTTAH